LLEREGPVGSAWQRHHDWPNLRTSKTYAGLPKMPWANAAARYASREQVVRCLQACATEHRIAPRLGTPANAIARRGDRYTVQANAGVLTP
jgi:cation diffusion facilitator CzcD-associated flavoprotein CzcO